MNELFLFLLLVVYLAWIDVKITFYCNISLVNDWYMMSKKTREKNWEAKFSRIRSLSFFYLLFNSMMHFNRETDVTKRWLVIFTLKLRVNIKNRMTFLIKKHNFAINRVITICILLLFSKDIKSFSLRLVIQS